MDCGADMTFHNDTETYVRQTIPERLDMTIGVEIEFILAVSSYPEKAGFENANQNEAYSLVRHALTQPMTGVCATCGAEHVFALQTHRNGCIDYENIHEYWETEEDGSLFLTKDEEDVWGEDGKFFLMWEIEIKSRILRPGRNFVTTPGDAASGHVHEINYVEEINAVIHRLHEFFSGPKGGNKVDNAHMVLNERCGLHVHVGNERTDFPLENVKRILSTYVANERAIDNLHAASRIGGSKFATMDLQKPRAELYPVDYSLQPMVYDPPWSSYLGGHTRDVRRHRLGHNNTRSSLPRPNDNEAMVYSETHFHDRAVSKAAASSYVGDWLTLIDKAPSLKGLRHLGGAFLGRPTVNLNNLNEHEFDSLIAGTYDDEPKYNMLSKSMTIEFRQHAGSLDATEINAWIDVVTSLVRHAHYISERDFYHLSRNEWLKPNHSSIELLQSLGCSAKTIQFYQTRLTLGLQPSIADASVFAANMDEIDLFPADTLIAPLLEYLAWKRQQDYHPRVVQDRIKHKFRMGRYGKFGNEYLDLLPGFDLFDPGLGLRAKLSKDLEGRELEGRE